MGFFWKCPCGKENFYSGRKTTDAVTTCSACKKSMKVFQYKVVVKSTNKQPKTTDKLPIIKFNGMVGDLIEALSWAINSIKNKIEVKEKREYSSYYRKYTRWCRHRDYFQSLEEEKR